MSAVVSISVGSEVWAEKVRRRARQLSKALDTGYLELAEILYHVYITPVNNDPSQGPLWTGWGYSSFGDYADQELGLARRKAERLRQIWFHVEERLGSQLDRDLKKRLYAVGWSKLREIASLLIPENTEKWLHLAENGSHAQVAAAAKQVRKRVDEARERKLAIRENPDGGLTMDGFEEEEALLRQIDIDDDSLKLRTKVFGLYPDQMANVEAALDRAEQLSKSDSSSNNLSLICMDFLATNDFGRENDPINILRYLSRMEQSLGVKLVAVDAKRKDVVYGMSTLEEMMEWA